MSRSGSALAALFLAAAGAWAFATAAPALPEARGRFAEFGTHRLHYTGAGTGHEGPTVVLETGFSGASFAWSWVEPQVAGFARVLAYDRAGLGWSLASPGPHDADEVARQLAEVLRQSGAPPPYVLVGHSLGGIFVRRFAQLHPDLVAGLVLVDASHPEQDTRLPAFRDGDPFLMVRIGRILARLGLDELTGVADAADSLPADAANAARAFLATSRHWDAMAAEARGFRDSLAQVRDGPSLPDVPMIVLSAPLRAPEGWMSLQAELADLTPTAEQRVIEEADHFGIVTSQAQSAHTVRAIRDLLTRLESTEADQAHPARAGGPSRDGSRHSHRPSERPSSAMKPLAGQLGSSQIENAKLAAIKSSAGRLAR